MFGQSSRDCCGIVDILLKFSSIVFVKYHVWFLFVDHFDQPELMFVESLGGSSETAPWQHQLQV